MGTSLADKPCVPQFGFLSTSLTAPSYVESFSVFVLHTSIEKQFCRSHLCMCVCVYRSLADPFLLYFLLFFSSLPSVANDRKKNKMHLKLTHTLNDSAPHILHLLAVGLSLCRPLPIPLSHSASARKMISTHRAKDRFFLRRPLGLFRFPLGLFRLSLHSEPVLITSPVEGVAALLLYGYCDLRTESKKKCFIACFAVIRSA